MSSIQRTQNEILGKFREQVELLNLANTNFDEGKEISALNIATTLRVLLHDTTSSTSALTHIGKKSIDFYDTTLDDLHPQSVYLGLVIKYFSGVNDGVGGEVLYKPLFSNEFHFRNKTWTDFNYWWDKIIFRNPDNTILTRKELVLSVANQDGGAHIDTKVTKKFDKFRHSYSGGFTIKGIKSGIVRKFDNIPVNPALRQISFELIESFKNVGLI